MGINHSNNNDISKSTTDTTTANAIKMKLFCLLFATQAVLVTASQTHPHCVKLADQIRIKQGMSWGCRNDPTKLAAHQRAMRPLNVKYYCECTDAHFKHAKCSKYSYYPANVSSPVNPRFRKYPSIRYGQRRY